ncbi:hypothetical protein LUZ60_001329 [Juncus effusus]|nr:hypothetical protein LUZ60_001329 [Juncus effusus]
MDFMAFDTSSLFSHQSLLDWDQLSFSFSNLHEFLPSLMESPMSSEASTGHFEDSMNLKDSNSLNETCKRRRTELSPPNAPNLPTEDLNYLVQDFWDSSEDPLELLNCEIEETKAISEKPTSSQETAPHHQEEQNRRENFFILPQKDSNKKRCVDVVYPFNVIKPAGLEGNTTLNDINHRILMRPARPVKHPVGDFKCGPCVSAGGPGLSGKSVVSLVRIQTRGSGSITIIRTRD